MQHYRDKEQDEFIDKKSIENILRDLHNKIVKQAQDYTKLKKQTKLKFIVKDEYRILIDKSKVNNKTEDDLCKAKNKPPALKKRSIAKIVRKVPKTEEIVNINSTFDSDINKSFSDASLVTEDKKISCTSFLNEIPYFGKEPIKTYKFVTKKEVKSVVACQKKFFFN